MAYYIDQSALSPSASAEEQWINNLLSTSAPMTTANSYSFNMNVPVVESNFSTADFPSLLEDNSVFSGSSRASTVSTPPIKEEDWDPCLESDSSDFMNTVSSKLQMMQSKNNLTPKALESIFDTKDVLKQSVESSPEQQQAPQPQQTHRSSKRRCPRKRLTESQKEAHNKVEKKYRVNINSKINSLQTVIPWFASDNGQKSRMDLKVNKSVILEKAFDYIVYLQKENEAMRKRLDRQ
ncbi:hypothetical protein FT663_05113 [Candidozyma haemuli var. vulneris]|uniref:BHLH domain-containing protein n=1 Tax=Candidozyma haemuli TaxID=45357 RepID=A0A2V1AS88_9ASCO|nr:hypothetical protein CXQ85_004476 [[Candida] haemuloni]KAF3985326.1 hypothetical protein FT662_05214 [[Candida] haemuloni var. vulneris]KAF3985899.1 hypothetical protein FT663_05113 [[Candida] haemuloni var. vulneris]PVH20960.1 hypothetical protein CXQ85_004476 [[Candida] haemuloni]